MSEKYTLRKHTRVFLIFHDSLDFLLFRLNNLVYVLVVSPGTITSLLMTLKLNRFEKVCHLTIVRYITFTSSLHFL